ncbi:hypothetical protein OESDEN_14299 [Oesophagostomum dentatum]|uniref:Uncharacterized protein n=1 Tax=Oesophagostomum dentatum TaxID=61180 RepID=A0A0B1SKV0_OESDE|nr:hypothetical protein OESDEN_14299 [Oesophagostomum dentatum]
MAVLPEAVVEAAADTPGGHLHHHLVAVTDNVSSTGSLLPSTE